MPDAVLLPNTELPKHKELFTQSLSGLIYAEGIQNMINQLWDCGPNRLEGWKVLLSICTVARSSFSQLDLQFPEREIIKDFSGFQDKM